MMSNPLARYIELIIAPFPLGNETKRVYVFNRIVKFMLYPNTATTWLNILDNYNVKRNLMMTATRNYNNQEIYPDITSMRDICVVERNETRTTYLAMEGLSSIVQGDQSYCPLPKHFFVK